MARMLVVDDDRGVSQVLSDYLRVRGHDVSEACGGKEALAVTRRHPFEMVFLDIAMPDMDGIDTLRRLKAEFPATIVVMISGIQDERRASMALELGAFDYIGKPFDLHTLDRVVSLGLALTA